MFLRLLLLLTVVPLVELVILLRIAERFDWGPTIALVVLTGALGAYLARREGLKALSRIQSDLAAGVPPAASLVDGVLILVAGIVLVTPGILTDLFGFALLISPIRAWVRRRLAEALRKRTVLIHRGPLDDIIDVEVTVHDSGVHSDRSLP